MIPFTTQIFCRKQSFRIPFGIELSQSTELCVGGKEMKEAAPRACGGRGPSVVSSFGEMAKCWGANVSRKLPFQAR